MGAEVPDPAPAVSQPRSRIKFFLQAAVASGFFTGYFPFAPATVTSFFSLVPAYFLSRQPFLAAGVIVVVFFLGVYLADELEKVWGKDPARVTIDEIVGTFITFFFNPVSFAGLAVGFVATHRVFLKSLVMPLYTLIHIRLRTSPELCNRYSRTTTCVLR